MTELSSKAPLIRPARPDDAPFLGWAICEAARGHLKRGWFDIVLRRDETFCVEFCRRLTLASARSWWHWSLFSVAEVNGAAASALCGFGDESVYRASGAAMAEASNATGISEAEQAELWPRGAFILGATTSEPGAWTIENVATSPAYRGTGVTQALLEQELQRAKAAGFRRAQISFFVGNEAAEHAIAMPASCSRKKSARRNSRPPWEFPACAALRAIFEKRNGRKAARLPAHIRASSCASALLTRKVQ